MGGPGHRGEERYTPKLLRLRRLHDNLYEAELITEQGERLRLQVIVNNDIVETPFGRYHLSSIGLVETEPTSTSSSAESWLVEFNTHTGELRAKLSMKIVEISKKPGERVKEGERIAVIETMKMLNDVHSPCNGEIIEITQPGQGLSPGGLLAKIKCEKKQE